MDGFTSHVLVLLFVTAVAALVTSSANSFIRQWEAEQGSTSGAHGLYSGNGYVNVQNGNKLDVEAFYSASDLKVFASQHQSDLIDAKKYRHRECGSIISVSALDCDLCYRFVEGARALVEKGFTQEVVVKFTTDACIELKIEDERVCKAVVQEFKDELFGTLIGVTLESKELCGYALGKDCGAPYNPAAMWNVTLPDTPKPPIIPPKPPKAGSPTLRVLHLTDFHLDAEYSAGSNTDCGEPLCCRADDGPPKPGETGAGRYGDYRNCDSAKIMVDSLFEHLQSIQDQFDYVLFTGDIPAHNVWNQTRGDQTVAMSTFTHYMKTYLPKKMMFPTLGNHESAPVNSFPPPYVTGNSSIDWLYSATADNWLQWLPSDTEANIRKGGYYSVSPFLGLRVISLNMNMCNNGNWWLFINATDPGNMLQWFIKELQAAEDKGEKVHVLGHIYPGCSCCLKPWSWNYYKIVNRYESTIVGQFFGHTHSMTYEVLYDEETLLRPLGVIYMPGSITTYSNLNPGFRIYEIDGNYAGSSWQVQDYTNYFLNLTDANLNGNPTWQKEYSAKETYGLTSLFPKDWNDLIYRMKTDNTLFNKFCSHTAKSAPNTSCDRNSTLCGLKTGRNGDPNLCRDI
ncbi:sphingomyelin phosphodiesterase-like [Mya arenaria]|uniref:sphingomyelin phosphodiesterase-like n=1 Tax=Mya arenaria TaxID=6604 RepID=UPI0022E7B95D|nr:sphingomyelin phosphodiesterase-like [Mya arenaria]XP_052797335.1 sphingomyelin phosphodiesterase-like [Mya arenaria]